MGNPLTRAGNFTRPIAILRRTTTTDDHNEEVEGEPTRVETLASVKPAPGTERFQSAETAAAAPMRFIIRYRPDPPTVKDAIELDGRAYAIASVTEIGTREGWEILATARAE